MQGMQGFAGPSHCSCISSHLHRLRGVASSQSFSSSQLAPAASVVRRQGGTKFAIRTITMRRGLPRPLQCLARGVSIYPDKRPSLDRVF
jgi:hypothetical protein